MVENHLLIFTVLTISFFIYTIDCKESFNYVPSNFPKGRKWVLTIDGILRVPERQPGSEQNDQVPEVNRFRMAKSFDFDPVNEGDVNPNDDTTPSEGYVYDRPMHELNVGYKSEQIQYLPKTVEYDNADAYPNPSSTEQPLNEGFVQMTNFENNPMYTEQNNEPEPYYYENVGGQEILYPAMQQNINTETHQRSFHEQDLANANMYYSNFGTSEQGYTSNNANGNYDQLSKIANVSPYNLALTPPSNVHILDPAILNQIRKRKSA